MRINEDAAREPGGAPPGRKALTLRTNFSWTLFGNVVYAGSMWLMLSVLAKLGTPKLLGEYALGLAVTAPIIQFAQLQLRSVQATDARGQYQFSDYLGLRLMTLGLALLVLLGVSFGGYHREAALVILIVGIGAAFDAISDVIYGLLQQHERMDRIAVSMIIKGPLSLIGLAAGMLVAHSVVWASVGSVLASIIVVFGYDIFSAKMMLQLLTPDEMPLNHLRRALDWKAPGAFATLGQLAWLSLPLGIAMMLVALSNNIPRYFIEHTGGAHDLGIFAALASVIAVGKLVITALGQAVTTRLAKYYAQGERRAFVLLLLKLVAISAVLGVVMPLGAILAGRHVLKILYTAEYAHNLSLFILILAAGGVGYVGTAFGCGVTATRRFGVQVPSCFAIMLTALLTGWWLIPSGGVHGAAVSLLLTAIMGILVSLVVMAYLLRETPDLPPENKELKAAPKSPTQKKSPYSPYPGLFIAQAGRRINESEETI